MIKTILSFFFTLFFILIFAQEISVNNSEKIIFMGDSITEGWVDLRGNFFSENNYINRGIGGQGTNQILRRFPEDVINAKATTVIILAGINDFLSKFETFNIEKTKKNLAEMAEMSKENGIKVVLCSLLPAYEFPTKKHIKPAAEIIELNKWIKEYSEKNDFIYVDYHSDMIDEKKGLRKEFSDDGIHPNEKGYMIMETILQKTLKELAPLK